MSGLAYAIINESITAVYQSETLTTFSDGRRLVASHSPQPGQDETARELGYDSVEQMNRDHDLLHTRLAGILNLPHSPALYAAAGGEPRLDPAVYALEEDAVKAIQKFANAIGAKIA